MRSEPSYLDLDNELYPTLTLCKDIVVDNPHDRFHAELTSRLAYNSHRRHIDLTEPLQDVLLPSNC